jgi:hypothetical protein
MALRVSGYSPREPEFREQKPISGVQRRQRPNRQACAMSQDASNHKS